jgi:hypothetical protein
VSLYLLNIFLLADTLIQTMSDFSNIEKLTALDLIMPKVYMANLTFRTTESTTTLQNTLQPGLDKLAAQVPWISGQVFPTTLENNKPSLEMR